MRLRLLALPVLAGSLSLAAALVPGSAVHAGRSVAAKPAIARDAIRAETTAAFNPDFTQGIGLYVYYYSVVCNIFGTNISNWGSCRNQDQQLGNDTNAIVRIYYSPDYKGAWACLPIWEYYSNLNHSDQTFNDGQGKPGYGQEVWENVASSAFGTGTCEHALPGGKADPPPS